MKNKYVTPDLKITKFSVANDLLVSVGEDKNLPGTSDDIAPKNGTSDYSLNGINGFNGPGFGWDS